MQMSDRIRYLEEALETLQSSCSPQIHPLLREDLLSIKTSVELYGGPQTGSDNIIESQENGGSPMSIGPSPFHLPETEAYGHGQVAFVRHRLVLSNAYVFPSSGSQPGKGGCATTSTYPRETPSA